MQLTKVLDAPKRAGIGEVKGPGDGPLGAKSTVYRRFLFLQGPHGPFFRDLALALKRDGHGAMRVGFSRADQREWGDAGGYQPYTGAMEAFPDWLTDLIEQRGVTDIVLYGDTRPAHGAALRAAKAKGLETHCFEEGYLRPYWITYERGGANGNSRLMDFAVRDMAAASRMANVELEEAPPIWGAAWRHAFHGFRHHADVLFRNHAYPDFAPHRPTSLSRELGLYLRRLLVLPLLVPERRLRERRLLRSGISYHLVLLQLAVDASMRSHSDFDTVAEFVDFCLSAFAAGGRPDHHIVFKTHPFEDGRERLEAHAKQRARELGLEDRVLFLQGGKLGALLDRARSAVTINSTAGQQALWRGLPLSVNGDAVYGKPEFTADQDLASFFAAPLAPDQGLYREFRQFLLLTSQLRGGFYSRRGRDVAIAAAVEKMIDPLDPYDRIFAASREAMAEQSAQSNIAVLNLPRARRANGKSEFL
ncbi:MAG: capsule biosynthesis protein CapA [Pseudomonadota bacterium]